MTPRWLGRLPYTEGIDKQLEARDRVLAGGPDELLLLEHDPVVTLGRRGGVVDEAALSALSTPVIRTDRGGFATWHGPGQLVGYPIVNLRRRKLAVPEFVGELGAWLVATCQALGVGEVSYDSCRPGVYRGGRKLGSIGLHIHKGVTTHGFALNVCNSLSGFDAIVVCGHEALKASTLSEERAQALSVEDAHKALLNAIAEGVTQGAPPQCTGP